MEMWFHEWLQVSFDYHLGDAVGDRGYPQRPGSTIVLRLVEVVREISLKVRNRLPVYASCTLVGSTLLYASHTSRFGMSNGRDGAARSSAEGSVTERERRGCVVQLWPGVNRRREEPHRYSDPRGRLPLGSLPSHRGDRFPRSAQEPGSESRRLHAGCRLGRKSGPPQTRPGLTTSASWPPPCRRRPPGQSVYSGLFRTNAGRTCRRRESATTSRC